MTGWTQYPRPETDVGGRRHWLLKGSDGRVIEHRLKSGLRTCHYAVAPVSLLISRHCTKRTVEHFVRQREGVAGNYV